MNRLRTASFVLAVLIAAATAISGSSGESSPSRDQEKPGGPQEQARPPLAWRYELVSEGLPDGPWLFDTATGRLYQAEGGKWKIRADTPAEPKDLKDEVEKAPRDGRFEFRASRLFDRSNGRLYKMDWRAKLWETEVQAPMKY